MKNNIQPLSGFTLIELIIGMAIIAIISGALWGNFFSSLSKGRDSRRKQDLESVAKALEIYYNDKKAYPTALPAFGETFVNSDNSAVIYMPKLPQDPAYPASSYCYPTIADGSSYKIYAKLENRSDPAILPTLAVCGSYSDYNYGISSQNITP